MAPSNKTTDYGAVDKQPVDRGTSYDIDNTYYVKGRTLTCKERTQKLLLIGIPILAALMIMGGFAYFLFSPRRLYPHSGGGGTSSEKSSSVHTPRNYYSGDKTTPKGPTVPAPITKPKEDSSSKGGGGPSACVDNIKCQQLGLTGECCPTHQGVFLGCCS